MKLQKYGQELEKGKDPSVLWCHALMYGVLTARGMAAGKSVCIELCAQTRDKKAGTHNKNQVEESDMPGQEDHKAARRRGRKGQMARKRGPGMVIGCREAASGG